MRVDIADRGVHAGALTARQKDIMVEVANYYIATGEPAPIRYLARRMDVHHSTIQDHLRALNRKGWLATAGPAVPLR